MKYEEIYSRSYIKRYDPNFYEDKEFAYDTMKDWLHEVAAFPYVRTAFNELILDDKLEEITYSLKTPVDASSDDEFIKKLFSDGFIICWMKPQVESIINLSMVIGGKSEKRIQSNYSANIERLDSLERKLSKYVRDYGYNFGTYGEE